MDIENLLKLVVMELAVARLNKSETSHTSFEEAMVEHFVEQIAALHLELGLVTVGMQADRFGVPVYFTYPEGMKTPEGAERVGLEKEVWCSEEMSVKVLYAARLGSHGVYVTREQSAFSKNRFGPPIYAIERVR